METSNGEFSDKFDITVETSEVGSEDDLGSNGRKLSVSGGVFLLKSGSCIENQNGFIDLYRVSTSSLQISEELLVDRKQLGQKGNRAESGFGIFGRLSKNKEGDRAKDDWASSDTSCLCLFEFVEGLVEVQLEVCLFRELGDNEMVVGVKPRRCFSLY